VKGVSKSNETGRIETASFASIVAMACVHSRGHRPDCVQCRAASDIRPNLWGKPHLDFRVPNPQDFAEVQSGNGGPSPVRKSAQNH
jgi:hypothetical protein